MQHVEVKDIEDNYDQFEVNLVMERFFTLSISDHLEIENMIRENKRRGIMELTDVILERIDES